MTTVQTSDPGIRQPQLLTHSRLACNRACPRRDYLRYECSLRPAVDGFALRVGTATHQCYEAIDNGQPYEEKISASMDNAYDMALVAAMVTGHINRWQGQDPEVVATEQEFVLPLVNPATGAPSTVWKIAGKIDRIVRLPDGRLALWEYKTTNRDFSPGADYWVQLRLDYQLSIYVNAARALDYDVSTVLYDVTRRPALRPLKATPEDQRKYTKECKLYANKRAQDETPEEFATRVAEDIATKPEHYFARIEIARLQYDLDECNAAIWAQQLAIRTAQRTGANAWYRNPEACLNPYPCAYINICTDRELETYTPEGFKRVENIHPELTQIDA